MAPEMLPQSDSLFTQGGSGCCRKHWMNSSKGMSKTAKITKDWLLGNFNCKGFFFLTGCFSL
jgi:hypothetical protein